MQPHFIPWLGYFYLILKSKKFIILDNVQFDKRSWQQRNIILVNNTKGWLTIPVITKGKYNQNISDVRIDYSTNFKNKHLTKIFYNYKNYKYFDEVYAIIEKIYKKDHDYLINLNIDLLKAICLFLKIEFQLVYASSLKIYKKKAELIYSIIMKFPYQTYLTPEGSRCYLEESKLFNNIDVRYLNYNPINYTSQKDFYQNLSIVDLLFNQGDQSRQFIEESFYFSH